MHGRDGCGADGARRRAVAVIIAGLAECGQGSAGSCGRVSSSFRMYRIGAWR